ncbi:MAG: hypothetical protein ACOZQL_28965 [Myxococcota bacterium]
MKRGVVLVLALAACVKRAPDGTVLRNLPLCETNGRTVRARPLEDAVTPCLRLLGLEPTDSSRSLLGLTTDGNGRITRVCVAGSTHERDSRFLNCVADQLERASPVLPANAHELVWTLNVSY